MDHQSGIRMIVLRRWDKPQGAASFLGWGLRWLPALEVREAGRGSIGDRLGVRRCLCGRKVDSRGRL